MEQIILILISLALGFWQGLKKRNKKQRKEIVVLENKLAELLDELRNVRRLERIKQYSNRNNQKVKKEKLETDLVSYITKENNNLTYALHYFSLLEFIFNVNDCTSIMDHYINSEELLKIVDDYKEQEIIENDKIDILVQYHDVKRFINSDLLFNDFKKFINTFSLDDYLVTNNEMMEIFKFVLLNFK